MDDQAYVVDSMDSLLAPGVTLIHEYFEAQQLGIFLLDAQFEVIFHNSSAKSLLLAADGLLAVNHRLQVKKCNRALCLFHFLGEQSLHKTIVKQLPRPSGKRAYLLQLISLPELPQSANTQSAYRRHAAHILCVSDPEVALDLGADHLRELYGFTAREASLTQLIAEGCCVTEIAQRLRISPNTVRFHLRSIFRKTETSSQVGLVRLLLSAPRLKTIQMNES